MKNETHIVSESSESTLIKVVPENGWRGLIHWKQDLIAGLTVALVSLPLSLAISVASGAPPVAGLITAIVAGLVLPCIGGSFVTISSPAAGMAPVLYHAIYTLGRGNLLAGYPLVLPLIVVSGLLQLLLSRFRISKLTNLMPSSVISGILTSIGLIIFVKQLPMLLGNNFEAHTFWGVLFELPGQLPEANFTVLALGLFTLLLIVVFRSLSKHFTFLKALPAFSYALFVGSLIGLFLPLSANSLLQLPSNPWESLVWPNWQNLIARKELWKDAVLAFVSILVVDTVESMATIKAVDNLDPFERASNPERSLAGVGACNIASGLLGGLTVIPEAVRSTVNVLAGARTQWANFWNALALLLGWLLLQPVLTKIPLTVLAAVLMASSCSLCKPAKWKNAWKAGKDDFAVFVITIVMTVTTDLFWGLVAGITLSLVLNYWKRLLK